METQSESRAVSPFSSGAAERLRHMGLLNTEGEPDREILTSLCCVFAGLLFDDLCDDCSTSKDVSTELQPLFEAAEYADAKQKFLLICLQYDGMFRDLPDPIWWISGNPVLAEPFADGFLRHLKLLTEEAAT